MERRNAIAVTAASAGVLVAGTVAALAVMNAATSSTDAAETTLTVVAPPTNSALVAPVASPAPATSELPAIVVPVAEKSKPSLTRKQAADLVANATGGTVLGTERTTHAGYDAYAVQVERTDGSVVTGLVEASSGVIYDWRMDREAAPVYTDDDGEYSDDEGEYEEEHDGEHGEDHGKHEGDDDDD